MTRRRANDSSAIILRAAAHPNGVTSQSVAKMLSVTYVRANVLMSEMLKRGALHRIRLRNAYRYFSCARRAMQAAAQALPQASPAPVLLAAWHPQSVVLPASIRVQRLPSPSHDPRYQCAPGEQPAGAGFAAAGIGRYLDEAAA